MTSTLRRYTQSEIRRIASRDELADGWYRFIVSKFDRKENENKPISLSLECKPLTDPEDAETAHRLSMYLQLPLQETESSGEIERFRFEQTGRVGALLLDDIGPMPVWNKVARKWTLDGETVDKNEAMAARDEALEKGLNGLIDAYNDSSNEVLGTLVGKVFYGCVVSKGSKNPQYAGTVFANITNICDAPPNDAKLVKPADFVFLPPAAEGEEAPAAKPAKKGVKGRR